MGSIFIYGARVGACAVLSFHGRTCGQGSFRLLRCLSDDTGSKRSLRAFRRGLHSAILITPVDPVEQQRSSHTRIHLFSSVGTRTLLEPRQTASWRSRWAGTLGAQFRSSHPFLSNAGSSRILGFCSGSRFVVEVDHSSLPDRDTTRLLLQPVAVITS